mmetsp:Transcript_19267/g.46307  ORF Transcript_19267/g.46307 Transcript_19267/m.46307 type:complete len:225 (-) Transcript_19267:517-1191(-)
MWGAALRCSSSASSARSNMSEMAYSGSSISGNSLFPRSITTFCRSVRGPWIALPRHTMPGCCLSATHMKGCFLGRLASCVIFLPAAAVIVTVLNGSSPPPFIVMKLGANIFFSISTTASLLARLLSCFWICCHAGDPLATDFTRELQSSMNCRSSTPSSTSAMASLFSISTHSSNRMLASCLFIRTCASHALIFSSSCITISSASKISSSAFLAMFSCSSARVP